MIIYSLESLPEAAYARAGGKAVGLNKLSNAGIGIADGFVIIGLSDEKDYAAATEYYKKSGLKKVAVRSSATGEDGVDFSAAGQYATVLNVEGEESFAAALGTCMSSLRSETAESYSAFFADSKSAEMSIVVQEMVGATAAGVAFTADPISGEQSVMIEAVRGLGEALVSGHARSESYIVPTGGSEEIKSGEILAGETVKTIAADALRAKEYFGQELDLEWALSPDGFVVWLQARPITTLCGAGIDELDCTDYDDDTVFTTCNVGEMLPGVITPLSLSTSVASIDTGLRLMLLRAGAYKSMRDIPPGSCITGFSNQLFIKLTTIYKMATTILGAAKGDVEASICGKTLETPPLPWKNKNILIRIKNSVKYFAFLFSRNKAKKRINKIVGKIDIAYSPDLAAHYDSIDKNLQLLNETMFNHYTTSAHSGAMSSALFAVLSKDNENEEEVRSLIAGLLEDIDGIESVDILRSMRALAREVLSAHPDARGMDVDTLSAVIENDGGSIKAAYDAFISRHGHRSVREAELRSKSWEMDKHGFMENVLTVIKTGAQEAEKPQSKVESYIAQATEGKKGIARGGIKYLINQSRAGVYNREYTKARFVRAVDCFKKAYVRLADDLVSAGALPDKDLIYFLTHAELGDLIKNRSSKYIKIALRRRRLMDEQAQLKYKDVYIGKPEPVCQEEMACGCGDVLKGAPISRGEVKGRARIVKSVEDAKMLQEGEIMVALFTDIGWSPYYSVIGGLITEVGSALSHGAVVAREYSLPLVVNVNNATNLIKTGDYISVNGNRGIVTILETFSG